MDKRLLIRGDNGAVIEPHNNQKGTCTVKIRNYKYMEPRPSRSQSRDVDVRKLIMAAEHSVKDLRARVL